LKVLVSTKNTEVSFLEIRGRGSTWMDSAWMERVIREDQMSRYWNIGRAAGELKMSYTEGELIKFLLSASKVSRR
jgi:hypothetical protein